jgi:hypothetical protein
MRKNHGAGPIVLCNPRRYDRIHSGRTSGRPSPIKFEVAYQARVAMDPVKFGIKHIEQFAQGRNRCVGSVCSCWKVSIGLTS